MTILSPFSEFPIKSLIFLEEQFSEFISLFKGSVLLL